MALLEATAMSLFLDQGGHGALIGWFSPSGLVKPIMDGFRFSQNCVTQLTQYVPRYATWQRLTLWLS
jgi:hypothetical protein